MNGKLFLIVGPSGSGKSSVLMDFKKTHPEYTYPLSATTRSMREGEKDGDIYHFYTKDDFEKGIKNDEFLEHAWEWKEKHGGIILEQLKKLGASCDWDRTKFTMDDEMSESVLLTFVDLFNKGHIYRGIRMVNWDPQAQTAVSDEEVSWVACTFL